MKKLSRASYFTLIAVLALTVASLPPAATGFTANPKTGAIAEVAADLYTTNEVMQELNPDMFKRPGNNVDIYGTGKYKTPQS